MILTIRTDKPEAEIGLFSGDGNQLKYLTWQAHRQLGETLHTRLAELLAGQGAEFADLTGVVFYQGPGSFTGLRIGAAVAGALSQSLKIALVNGGEDWLKLGLERLKAGESEEVKIFYGEEPRTTLPRK